MKFAHVARAFSLIEQEQSRIAITELLAQLLAEADAQEASIICNMALGQLHSAYVGTQFELARKSLTPVVAALLGLTLKEVEHALSTSGDLGSVILQHDANSSRSDMQLVQVYEALKKIEGVSGTGSIELKQAELFKLLKQLDALSACYVVRIVIGKLRLGFSDMTVLDALSWMVCEDKSLRPRLEHAYNISADLGALALLLKSGGIQAISAISITIGIPIRPAAAERLPTAQAIFEKIGPCVAQPKLDGFRVQVHVQKSNGNTQVMFFSRSLNNMTAMFPDLARAVAALDCQDAIFEGEAICYDPNTGNFLPFQQTAKRRRKHDIEAIKQEFPLKLFVFDALYLNGKSLLALGHEQRRTKCAELIASDKDAIIHLVEERKMSSAQELQAYFEENISAGLEGLVVKRPNAPYTPGKRNFNWIKLKRHQKGHVEDSFDCVLLGYYHGHGKRAQFGIGAFLVGIFNAKADQFETIAKVGTGLSDKEWIDLRRRADAIKAPGKPNNVVCSKELFPDVWTYPELVCEIIADEISRSPVHSAGATDHENGYALRFPRFIRYRSDKGSFEATALQEVKEMYEDQFKK